MVVAAGLEEYNAVAVGSRLPAVDQSRNTMLSAGREATIPRQLMTSHALQLFFLNESNLVVGKKALPAGSGARELYMDLEGGRFAFSAASVHEQLQSNYQEAVGRVGDMCSDDVGLTDADIAFFNAQRQRSEELALLLPVFGLQAEEEGLASFEAFLERQVRSGARVWLASDGSGVQGLG